MKANENLKNELHRTTKESLRLTSEVNNLQHLALDLIKKTKHLGSVEGIE